ncbi:MAG: helix-turn-helix domain-containing protein [Rhodobacteraceae bacterium]|nr:helix-turn-helix domain-containing protein [Paracoccaceae bacterium]
MSGEESKGGIAMNVRQMRESRGWSQEDLAAAAGLSARTVQRIERGQVPRGDSLQSLAAAFETSVKDLRSEQRVDAGLDPDYVKAIKGLQMHLVSFAVCSPALCLFNLLVTPEQIWVQWAVLPWVLGVALHMLMLRIQFGKVQVFL